MSQTSAASQTLGQRFSRWAEIIGRSVYDHPPGVIVLSSGLAYPPCLPDVVREAGAAAGEYLTESMQYGPLMGLPDLRQAIADYVREDGIQATIDNVLITYGAKSALDLACRVYIEPGDRMIVTRPSYMTALTIMRTHGVNFLAVDVDEDGLIVEQLLEQLKRLEANGERMPKLLFDVPDFHNPTGITMSLKRRQALIELAKQYNFVILEDDPYRRIRFEGTAIPPLKALDDANVVISLGTVSKILAPGLRIGWAIGESSVVRRMALQKADGGCNPMAQRIVVDLIRSNKIYNHIDEVTNEMRLHRDAMIEAFRQYLPEAEIRTPKGGYFLWASLPEGTDAEKVSELAINHGVEVSTGRLCFAEQSPTNYLRLAYSFVSEENIRIGISKLATAYREYKSNL